MQRIWFPLTFLGFGVLGASVPVPHMEPRRSRLRTDCRIHAPCRCTDETGRLRMFPHSHVPDASKLHKNWDGLFLILTGISVVYGAFSALCVQTDLKYINAYSSVSHCGLVLVRHPDDEPEQLARVLFCRCSLTD